MTPYDTRYAELYDLFYADKPYREEASFLDAIMREDSNGPSARLLDVACGTGRHAVEFAALGWDVVGLDRSEAMLDQARSRAADQQIRFELQDMTTMDLEGERFDAATCLFDSIGYALTNDGVVASLDGIRRHLRPHGLLGLEFWHAPAMYTRHDSFRLREWSLEGAGVLRASSTSLDATSGTATVAYSVYRLGDDGTYDSWQEQHQNRFFQVQEMALLLSNGGFDPLRFYAGYSHEPISEATWHIVSVARARSTGSP